MKAIRTGLLWAAISLAMTAAIVFILTFPRAARAHGDYAWIGDNGYKGTDGLHCCGPSDCKEIPAASVAITPDGRSYATPEGNVGLGGTYHSRDGKAWICRFKNGPPKCLFVPGGG